MQEVPGANSWRNSYSHGVHRVGLVFCVGLRVGEGLRKFGLELEVVADSERVEELGGGLGVREGL